MAGYFGRGRPITGINTYTKTQSDDRFRDSISGDMLPDSDDTRDLGSSSKAWAEAYINDVTVSGDLSVADKIIHSGDTNTSIRFPAADTVTVETAGTERIRIDASGNFLVGTADSTLVGRADSARLCIDNLDGEDCVQLKGSGDDHLTIASWVPITGTTAYHIGFGDGTGSYTERGVISTNGSTTTYGTTSDYRLKENVVPLQNAANRVFQLKPSRFNFIDSPNFVLDGFLAHEVQEIVPEAVVGKKDGMKKNGEPQYQHFDASKLVPLLTAALQEALGRIETLEAEVAALKGQ